MSKNMSGKNIRFFREAKGLSRKEVAQRMTDMGWETSTRHLADMERGQCKIYDIDLLLLSHILLVSVNDLMADGG